MNNTTTTETNERFYLGELTAGRVYIFTGLGGFKSAAQAVAKWDSSPRNGSAVVFRQADLKRYGVVYGCTDFEAVTVAG